MLSPFVGSHPRIGEGPASTERPGTSALGLAPCGHEGDEPLDRELGIARGTLHALVRLREHDHRPAEPLRLPALRVAARAVHLPGREPELRGDLAAASTHDIYLPLTGREANDARTLKMGKLFALVWGVILTGGALLFPQNSSTPVVVVALSIASFTYGGLLGGFFLGIFWRRAIQRDAILGMAVGIACMSVIVFAKPLAAAFPGAAHRLAPLSTIAYPWFVLIGTLITFITGMLSSFTHADPDRLPAPPTRTASVGA